MDTHHEHRQQQLRCPYYQCCVLRAVPSTGTTAGCCNVARIDSSRLKRSRSAEVAMRQRLTATARPRHRPRNTVLSAPSDILPTGVRKGVLRVRLCFLRSRRISCGRSQGAKHGGKPLPAACPPARPRSAVWRLSGKTHRSPTSLACAQTDSRVGIVDGQLQPGSGEGVT